MRKAISDRIAIKPIMVDASTQTDPLLTVVQTIARQVFDQWEASFEEQIRLERLRLNEEIRRLSESNS